MIILIVDDHPLLRAGLGRLFSIEFDATIAEAADAAEALLLFRSLAPDVTLLDLNLPGEGGLSLLQTMRADDRNARIIILSMHSDVWSAEAALKLGALGYVSKSAPPDMILEAITLARSGQGFVEPAIAEALAHKSSGDATDGFGSLTVQDLDLLRLLLDGQRPEQIAQRLGIAEKTVANRKSLLRSKLGVGSDLELRRSAEAAGFLPR
jgi:DNA-binding NarL/FixJ family response regulator